MAIRKTVRILATGTFVLLLAPVVGDFFVEIARENGFYNNATGRVQAVVDWAQSIVGEQGFYWLLFWLGGLVAGLWLDVILKRREPDNADAVQQLTERLRMLLDMRFDEPKEGWGTLTPRGTTWRGELLALEAIMLRANFRPLTINNASADKSVSKTIAGLRRHWAHLYPLLETGHVNIARAGNAFVVARLSGEIPSSGEIPTYEMPSLFRRLLGAKPKLLSPPGTEPETPP